MNHTNRTRVGSMALSVLLILAMLLTNVPFPLPSVQASGLTEVTWHSNLQRYGNTYSVIKVMDGSTLVGVYAKDANGSRVSDPELEELLVFDAATIDNQSNISLLPTYSANRLSGNNWDKFSWARQYYQFGEQPYMKGPVFLSYAYPWYESSLYTTDNPEMTFFYYGLLGSNWTDPGIVFLSKLKGMGNETHLINLYADVIFEITTQAFLNDAEGLENYELSIDQLNEIKSHLSDDPESVRLIDKMLDAKKPQTLTTIQRSKVSKVFSLAANLFGKDSIWFDASALMFGETPDLVINLNAHHVFAYYQFMNSLGNAEKRLQDLSNYWCGNPDICTGNDTKMKAIEVTRARFYELRTNQKDLFSTALNDMTVITSTSVFQNKLVQIVISHFLTTGLSFLPAVLLTGPFVLGFMFLDWKDTQDAGTQRIMDQLNKLFIKYEIYSEIRNGYTSISGPLSYKLSLLNIANFSIYSYFHQIEERAKLLPDTDPDIGWFFFHQDLQNCKKINTEYSSCLRKIVLNETQIEKSNAKREFFLTRNGHYLTNESKEDLRSKILPRCDQAACLSKPSIYPDGVGTTNTDYIFSVVYSNDNNQPPSSISLVVDGIHYPLQKDSNNSNYSVGVVYSIKNLNFSVGNHNYYFEVISNGQTFRVPVDYQNTFSVATYNSAPSIQLFSPNNDKAFRYFMIEWEDDDPDDNAIISLGYDTDGAGCDGTLITDWLSEDWTTDYYFWRDIPQTSGQQYFVYATIRDESHPPNCVYAPGPLVVETPARTDHFTFSRAVVDDWKQGNGNSIWEKGEQVEIKAFIKNKSNAFLTDVYAQLERFEGGVQVTREEANYWAFQPDMVNSGTFEAKGGIYYHGWVGFRLVIYYREDEGPLMKDTEYFYMYITEPGTEPELVITDISFDDSEKGDGDGLPESGEESMLTSIELTNIGGAGAYNYVVGTLAQPPELPTFWLEDAADYPDIPPGSSARNEQYFKTSLIPQEFSGETHHTLTVDYSHHTYSQDIDFTINVLPVPRIKINPNDIYFNYGVVSPGTQVTRDITVTNVGNQMAVIASVSTSHPDLTFPNHPTAIPPGASVVFTGILDTTGLSGPVERTYTINSNAHLLSKNTGVFSGTVAEIEPASFELLATYSEIPYPKGIGAGDFNGNGTDELVILSGTNPSPVLTAYKRNGENSYEPYWNSGALIPFRNNIGDSALAVGDVTGDGRADIVYTSAHSELGGSNLYLLRGNANDTFTIYSTAVSSYSPAIGDSDHDGSANIAVTTWVNDPTNPARVLVYEWNGSGLQLTWTSPTITNPDNSNPMNLCGTIIADSDNDGNNEIIFGSEFGHLIIYETTGNNSYQRRYLNRIKTQSSDNPCAIAVDDLDGDGYAEVFFGDSKDNKIAVVESIGDNSWNLIRVEPWADAGRRVYSLNTSDTDMDGKGELIIGTGGSLEDATAYLIESLGDNVYGEIWRKSGLKYIQGIAVTNTNDTPEDEVVLLNDDQQFYIFGLYYPKDLIITNSDINFSENPAVEDEVFNVSGHVMNNSATRVDSVNVEFYNGNPQTGGQFIASQVIEEIAARSSGSLQHSTSFSDAGTYEIYVLVDPDNTIDETNENNNKSHAAVTIIDDDDTGPVISQIIVSETNGDGDGWIEDNEQALVSWLASDPAGISETTIAIDCPVGAVSDLGSGNYRAAVGPCNAGSHLYTITASDADNSPAQSNSSEMILDVYSHAPVIQNTNPVNGAGSVLRSSVVSVWFGSQMDSSTINTSSFVLDTMGGQPIPGVVNFDATPNRAVFTPLEKLPGSTTFVAKLKGGANGIKDDRNNNLASDYSWQFTTAPNQAPQIPFDPQPSDGEIFLPGSSVVGRWQANDPDNDPLSFDVYFGKNNPPSQIICNDVVDRACDFGQLNEAGTYYWRVIADDGNLQSSSPVWRLIVEDPKPKATIEYPEYAIDEGDGTLKIRIVLDRPSDGTAQIYFGQTPITADSNDFTLAPTNILFSEPGQTYAEVEIPILNDSLIEGDETFELYLSNAVQCEIGPHASAVVTIIDDDFYSVSTKPFLLSPVKGQNINSPSVDLSWSSVPHAAQYEILIDNNYYFKPPFVQTALTDQGYLKTDLLPDGKYFWRVRGLNPAGIPGPWSGYLVFMVDTIPPAVPKLYKPNDLASVYGTPIFSWYAASGAKYYQLLITDQDDPEFTDPVYISASNLTVTRHTPPLLEPGDYLWKVRAWDLAGNQSESMPRSITIQAGTPPAPVLIAPETGSVTGDATPTFLWEGVIYAQKYQIMVDTNTLFQKPFTILDFSGEGETSYTAPQDLASRKYFWRVRAINEFGVAGKWSARRSLTIDTTLPPEMDCYLLETGFTGQGQAIQLSPTHSEGCSTGYFTAGQVVSLGAQPAAGWHVSGWSGTVNDASIETDNSVTMPESDWSVQVMYAENLVCSKLTVFHEGQGADPGITPTFSTGCPAEHFIAGQVVNLTAYPADGWHVSAWSGSDDDGLSTLQNTITMPSYSVTVGVVYDQDPENCYALALQVNGGGGTAPIASPANSSGCPVGQYIAGESIGLTAYPDNGWHVLSWSGTDDDESISRTNSLVMPQSARQVTVAYEQDSVCQVRFEQDSYEVWENAGSVTLRVVLNQPSDGSVRVYADQEEGTADFDDFTHSFGYINFFTVGQTFFDLVLPITDDDLVEGSETFSYVMSSPVNCTLGTPATAQVTIMDDDELPGFEFTDDFSTQKDWVDESYGNIYRDAVNERLSWAVTRSQTRRYYISTPIKSDQVDLSFRLKITGYDGNGNVFVGLAEKLSGGDIGVPDYTDFPSGFFLSFNVDIGAGKKPIYPWVTYQDRAHYGGWVPSDTSTYINMPAINAWYDVNLTIDGSNWNLVARDSGGTQIGQINGTLPQTHANYKNLIIFRHSIVPVEWESEQGLLDDIVLMGVPR